MNGDRIKDLFLAGNFYGVKPQTGRFDANYGTRFFGDASHHFNYIEPAKSGIFNHGEAGNIATVKASNGDEYLVVAIKKDSLYLFKKKKKRT